MSVNENKEMPQIDKSAFSERYIQRQHHQGHKEKMRLRRVKLNQKK